MKVQILKVFMASVALFGGSLVIAAPASPTTKSKDLASGFYLGAELGWSAIFTKATETTNEANATNKTTTSINSFPPVGNVGVKLGYTHFFNKWIGIRGYASYHYGFSYTNSNTTTSETNAATTQKTSTLLSYHQVAGNVEATFKFFDISGVGLGAYAGLGAGYGSADTSATSTETNTTTTTNTKIANGFVLPVNVGLEVYMGKHHNASLNFRIPTLATTLSTTDTAQSTTTKNELRNLIITLGYSYTF